MIIIKIQQVANGVFKFTAGQPEALTPMSVLGGDISFEKPDILPSASLPIKESDIECIQSARGCVVKMPLEVGEQIFGFGLQLKSVKATGRKRCIRCNADALVSSGDSHAPAPFYVTTCGYGVLVDSARYISFYCGGSEKFDPSGDSVENARNAVANSTDDLYTVPPSRPGRKMIIDIPASGADIYLFSGPEMSDAVSRYNLFSGGGCLPALWGLGVWYRAHSWADQKSALAIAETLRRDKTPCDVFGLEPGWQSHSYSCSYLWDEERFPDPKAFIDKMSKNGFKINLWEHVFVHPTSDIYAPLTEYAGDYKVFRGLVPDLADPDAKKIFGNYHGEKFIDSGISGFKADECDGSDFTGGWSFPNCALFPSGLDGEQMHNLLGLLYQKTLEEEFRARNKRTYGSVRASGALAAAHPFVLYSDLYDLRDFVRGMVSMGFSGLLWAPEVRQCDSEEDLIKRLAIVIFSPIALVDCWTFPSPPWYQFDTKKNIDGDFLPNKEALTAAANRLLSLRTKLIPYLYSAFAKYHQTGRPPFRAIVMDYPDDPMTYGIEDAYLMGDDMLIAPLFCGEENRKVYLPQGNWYDFHTNKKYVGGQTHTVCGGFEEIPVFIKSGAILPLAEPTECVLEDTVFRLTAYCYGEVYRDFDLFSDDGISFNYENGRFSILRLSMKNGNGCAEEIKNPMCTENTVPVRYEVEKYIIIK